MNALSENGLLNYLGLGKLLQRIHMCNLNFESTSYAEERSLVKLIWEEIGEDESGIKFDDLRNFLFAIMGYSLL